jgi:hypothetical protein
MKDLRSVRRVRRWLAQIPAVSLHSGSECNRHCAAKTFWHSMYIRAKRRIEVAVFVYSDVGSVASHICLLPIIS